MENIKYSDKKKAISKIIFQLKLSSIFVHKELPMHSIVVHFMTLSISLTPFERDLVTRLHIHLNYIILLVKNDE